MRLRKGSYYYILGVFFFALSSLSALLSGITGISYGQKGIADNPLLGQIGNLAAGAVPVAVFSFVLSVCTLVFSFFVLQNGLRRNDLILPFRMIGGGLILFSFAVCLYLVWIWLREGKSFSPECFLCFVPFFSVGVLLFAVAGNRNASRMPTVFFGAMSCYAAFSFFGFEQIFLSPANGLTDGQVLGWSSLFLTSLSIGFLFLAVCFCVESCEPRPPKTGAQS